MKYLLDTNVLSDTLPPNDTKKTPTCHDHKILKTLFLTSKFLKHGLQITGKGSIFDGQYQIEPPVGFI